MAHSDSTGHARYIMARIQFTDYILIGYPTTEVDAGRSPFNFVLWH